MGLVKATNEGGRGKAKKKKEKNMRTDRLEPIETKGDGEPPRVFWSLISLSQSPHVAIIHNQYYPSKIKLREVPLSLCTHTEILKNSSMLEASSWRSFLKHTIMKSRK